MLPPFWPTIGQQLINDLSMEGYIPLYFEQEIKYIPQMNLIHI